MNVKNEILTIIDIELHFFADERQALSYEKTCHTNTKFWGQ